MKNLDRLSKKKLGEILIDEGLCSRGQIEEALAVQRKSTDNAPLGNILLDTIPDLTEADISRAISKQFSLPCLYAANYKVEPSAIELMDRALMYEYIFVPLDIIGNTLIVVMGGLLSADVVSQIESETGMEIFIYVSTASDVMHALQTHAPFDDEAEAAASELGGDDFDWEAMFDEADQALSDD